MDIVSVGCDRLDTLLGGGIPSERSVLVTGPPGAGKTTLGMQFLQEGIDRGEECLFVSTEQSVDELQDTFEPYPFDVTAPELTVVTINAEQGETLESEDDMVVRTLEGGTQSLTEGFELPFTRRNLVQYFAEYGPKDRVLLDSVSGIRPMADDRVSFWRATYSLVRLFTGRFEATTVLTAQGGHNSPVGTDLIRYVTHGVCDIDWETVAGTRHRFLRVAKMRGRDHDDRRHKLLLTDDGVRVRPEARTPSAHAVEYEHLSTGIAGLDDLLGGGLVRGGFALLTHDGTTGYYTINAQLLARAADEGMTLAVTLPAEVSLDRLDQYWDRTDWDVDALLEADRLVVLELAGGCGRDHRNVVSYDAESGRDWERLMQLSYERSGGDPIFALIDTEPVLQTVSEQRARTVRYQAATGHSGPDDVVVYTINPRIQSDQLVAFLTDTSDQTVEIHRDDDGLEWASLSKSPTGEPGSSRLVAYESDPPYVDFV